MKKQKLRAAKFGKFEKQFGNDSNAYGINGGKIIEPVPQYNKSANENVINGPSGIMIVLGRDRYGSKSEGYGAEGDERCGAIDIFVPDLEIEGLDETGDTIFVEKNFENDAIRIYGSAKCDVDDYFSLGRDDSSKAQSAVALKADEIRIIARHKIKIISDVSATNAAGGKINQIGGVEICAGTDLMPSQFNALGENVKECFESLTKQLEDLIGIVDDLLMTQTKFNQKLMVHTHFAPVLGKTTPSEEAFFQGTQTVMSHMSKTKMSLVNIRFNITSLKMKYFSQAGSKCVQSRYNKGN